MAKDKAERVTLWIGPGRLSFPYLSAVDTGREFSDGAYKTDLLISKATFKEKGQPWQDAVLKVGRDTFGKNFKLVGGKQRIPFKDMDKDESVENEAMKDSILVRAKSAPRKMPDGSVKPARKPLIIGPRKVGNTFPELSAEEIAAIKGGDWGMIQVTVGAYKQKTKEYDGGVTFYLNAVQFWKPGDAFGQGRSKLLETAEELEAEGLEEAEDNDVDSPDSSEEASQSII